MWRPGYLEIVEAMLEHQSSKLYVGPLLDNLEDADTLKKHMGRIMRVPVTNDPAATMFSMNMQTWKQNPFIQENFKPTTLAQLERGLHTLMEEPIAETSIEWGLRQVVYQRV